MDINAAEMLDELHQFPEDATLSWAFAPRVISAKCF
jgi:hypothetical protein